MNILANKITFGVKKFKQFRKSLVHDYKKGKPQDHKNPHAIPLELKQKLLKVNLETCSRPKEEIGKRSGNSKGRA